ncbi:hypothetical protein [Allokutzneria sp. NRRL B-24872]|uniref:hypothetical protein n=1 Tax=Allokutzneria sp. NRRL B-24872 TaxID=1137961 RepID=UPI001177E79C|nr:hypothetical protein [Allokutzneria sp. NRRL B-24872]
MNAREMTGEDYLRAVRAHLADLPREQVEDIVADIAPQIHEGGGRPEDPRDYADELRRAAGLPQLLRGRVTARVALVGLVLGVTSATALGWLNLWASRYDNQIQLLIAMAGLVLALLAATVVPRLGPAAASFMALPEVSAVRFEFARSLQPGWWVVRSLLIVSPVLLAHHPSWLQVVGLCSLAVTALWVGPMARVDRRWLWLSLPLTGFALGTVAMLTGVFWDNAIYVTNEGGYELVSRDWP